MDRISNLPNEIICHIISFVSAKEAAFASVLSKRWQNLFTIIQDIEFDDTVENQESLIDFLDDKVLSLPLSSRVRTLSLKCQKGFDPTQYAQVNRRLCNVLKRGVLEVRLDMNAEHGGYSLLFEVFTCKTVVKLDLRTRFTIDLFPENAFLPALKNLIVDSFEINNSGLRKLHSACPVLVRIEIGRLGVRVIHLPLPRIKPANLKNHHTTC